MGERFIFLTFLRGPKDPSDDFQGKRYEKLVSIVKVICDRSMQNKMTRINSKKRFSDKKYLHDYLKIFWNKIRGVSSTFYVVFS